MAQAQDSAARTSPLRALFRRHPPWYLELALVAVLLWGMDAVTGFRGGARVAGLAHGADVRALSRDVGGHVTLIMNGWLAGHAWLAAAAAGYYVVLHGLVTGVVGIALLRSRPPRFSLHRNALILSTAIGVAVFWLYPVAPPRMLPGFHDIASDTVPLFAQLLDSKAAGMFAALPSLHVIWAIWVAVALQAILRRRPWRALIWAYPALTTADVMATGNHYLLDVLAGPVVVLLAYAIAAGAQAAGRAGRRPAAARERRGTPAWAAGIVRAGGPVAPTRTAGLAAPTVPNARIPVPIGRLARRAETPGTGPTADSCQDRQPTRRTASRQATRSRHELIRSGHYNAGDFIRYLRFWVPGFATA